MLVNRMEFLLKLNVLCEIPSNEALTHAIIDNSIANDAGGSRMRRQRKPSEKILELQAEKVKKPLKPSGRLSKVKNKSVADLDNGNGFLGDDVSDQYNQILNLIYFSICISVISFSCGQLRGLGFFAPSFLKFVVGLVKYVYFLGFMPHQVNVWLNYEREGFRCHCLVLVA